MFLVVRSGLARGCAGKGREIKGKGRLWHGEVLMTSIQKLVWLWSLGVRLRGSDFVWGGLEM